MSANIDLIYDVDTIIEALEAIEKSKASLVKLSKEFNHDPKIQAALKFMIAEQENNFNFLKEIALLIRLTENKAA